MYFFIDPSNLTSQTINDAYGPLSTDPTNIYNTTSRFDLTVEAKAFACQSGLMLVQQSEEDDSLVNLVIAPLNNITSNPLHVEYFIYRGILKNSLINDDGTTCTIQAYNAASSNDLVSRIRQDPNANDYSCGQIGYSNDVDNLTLLDGFFTKNNPVVGPIQINAIDVTEGEWIGTFTTNHKIGFEVVLKSDFNNFDIDYLRAATHQINVTSLANFEQRLKREEILKFIDPAAFFGMFHGTDDGVNFYLEGETNNTQTTSDNYGDDYFIYAQLLENFITANTVYVDIRSEKGYSYNFYQNYGDTANNDNNIQIRTLSGNTPLVAQQYRTNQNQWPILILTATHNNGNENSLKLKLRINDNIKPILYTKTSLNRDIRNVADTANINVTSRYFKTDELIGNGTNPDHTTWTNRFRLLFPNTRYGVDGNSNRDYISNYVRLHYFKTKNNTFTADGIPNDYDASNVPPNTVLQNIHYLDSAFPSIDIPQFQVPDNVATGHVESANPIYVREPLHYDGDHANYDEAENQSYNEYYNVDGIGNFELNMINGAYWGGGRVLMYTKIEYENSAKTSEKEYLNTYESEILSATDTIPYFTEFRSRLEFICREYEIDGNDENTKIISVNFFRSNDLGGNRNNAGKNHKENCMLLGLTIEEMQSVKGDNQLGDGHHRSIFLESLDGNPLTDDADNGYFAYRVRLQGFNANEQQAIVTPQHNYNDTDSDIIVYSRDNQFFHSYAFSENEDVTTLQDGTDLQNRIEFHVYHPNDDNIGIVKITDNVDLALALAYNQNRVHYIHHDADDNTSEMQGINEDNTNTEDGFELVMANKMRRLKYQNWSGGQISFPENQFPEENTLTFIDNYQDYGITNVSAGNTYSNARGDILAKPASDNGFRWYRNQKWSDKNEIAKCFLVKFISNRNPDQGNPITLLEFTNVNPNINLRYHQTMRLYPSLEVAAAMIGALIMFNNDAESTGFAYKDASCYPSALHVNGESVDTRYQSTTQLNVSFINALRAFGFGYFRIGITGHNTSDNIYNHSDFAEIRRDIFKRDSSGALHSSHLHSEQVTLNDGDRVL